MRKFSFKHNLSAILFTFIATIAFSQEFDLESFLDDHRTEFPDEHLMDIALDSLNISYFGGSYSGLASGNFGRSADDLILLYQFIGESCGAYCNPLYLSILEIKIDEQYVYFEMDSDLDFVVDSIYTLSKNKYLFMGSGGGRPRGVETVWGQDATHIMITDQPMFVWHVSAYTSSMVRSEEPVAEMTFDSSTKILRYRYDWYDEYEGFEVIRKSGQFRYDGESFLPF